MREEYTIFHLSDTHYNGENVDLLGLVLAYLVEIAPRYVLFTGDVVDGPKYSPRPFVRMIREALAEVEKKTGRPPVFLVIPGNHDFFWKGTYGLRKDRLFYQAFREQERSFFFSAEDEIAVAPFDSNRVLEPRGGFRRRLLQRIRYKSHGLVIERDFDDFSRRVHELKKSNDGMAYGRSLKIALIHHHPLPTPYNYLPALADEGYMMLENAGVFIYRLIQDDFELVLHGHRHYPQFCRAAYYDPMGQEKVISVLGCGSSGKPYDQWIAGYGHNFNLIHVHRDGSVTARQYFKFGTGSFLPAERVIIIRGPRRTERSVAHEPGGWFGPQF
jgi:predicted MPP superfamily phosphohydrolase